MNAFAFDQLGFGSALAGHVSAGAISPLDYRRVRYYAPAAADHARANDTALVVGVLETVASRMLRFV